MAEPDRAEEIAEAIKLYAKVAELIAFLEQTMNSDGEAPDFPRWRLRYAASEADELGRKLRALSPEPAFQQLVQDAWEVGCANGVARAVRAIAERSASEAKEEANE